MSRLNDLYRYYGKSPPFLLRKLALEFEQHEQYYCQFDTIDEMIWAAYEKWVNHKFVGEI